jgi:HemY protein
VKALLWALAIAALAVAVVLAAHNSAGYVMLVLPPWRVEMSLILAAVLCALGIAVGYFVLRIAFYTLTMPRRVRLFQVQRQRSRARAAFDSALIAYFEGRLGRAERLAAQALELGAAPALCAVLAARCAHGTHAYSVRDAYLAQAAERAPTERAVRVMAQAEMLLDERRYHDALEVLRQHPDKHTAALRLELRAQQLARNWDRVLALLPQLERRKVFEPGVADTLKRNAYCEAVRSKSRDLRLLNEYWGRLPESIRREPSVATVAARSYLALGESQRAELIIEQGLESQWDAGLLVLYSEGPAEDLRRRLERAENWLQTRPRDAALLQVLGELCVREGLWGKAQHYLEASLAIEPSYTATLALGRVLERMGQPEQANDRYREALEFSLELPVTARRGAE